MKAILLSVGLCLFQCVTLATVVPATATIEVAAPFPMPPIALPRIPAREWTLREFGVAPGQGEAVTEALRRAIAACHAAGGGRVRIPAGEWRTGAVHLKSRVNLHLEEGAVLRFSDDPADYLPAVPTSWEGIECYNYSPLIYAYGCEDVAITGKGRLEAELGTWRKWYARPPAHMEALKALYHQMSRGVPVEERQMAQGENNLRPHFIQFNRCERILVEGVKIQNSPFWTLHLYHSRDAVVRGVEIVAHGHNNDGIDPEMMQNLLVEDCIFDQGDDAIAIKAGSNHDGWRLGRPTENIVIRRCLVRRGHQLVAIGSEVSGGIRNVYVHDCEFQNPPEDPPQHLLFIKTNRRRGGFVENIHMERIRADTTKVGVFGIETDVLYQWRNLVPTYEERLTRIRGIHFRNVQVQQTKTAFRILGDADLPVEDVTLEGVTVGRATSQVRDYRHVQNLRESHLQVRELGPAPQP